MENKIANHLSQKLVTLSIIPSKYKEVYTYGIELILSFMISVMSIIVIGAICNRVIASFIFLLIFIALRRYTGGYHADTHFKCKIWTISIYLIVIIFSEIFIMINILCRMLLYIIGIFIILSYAPIDNPNKSLARQSRKKHKIISLLIYSLLSSLSYTLSFFNESWSKTVYFSLLAVIALMIIAIYKERRHKRNEKTC